MMSGRCEVKQCEVKRTLALEKIDPAALKRLIAAGAAKAYRANPNLLPTVCRRALQERTRLLLTRLAEERVKDEPDTDSEDSV